MKRGVAGIGLVSPIGMTTRDHAFFLRARVQVPGGSPFVDDQGKRVEAVFCPWIGARASVIERVARMGEIAMHEACDGERREVELLVVLPDPRPGFGEEHGAAVVQRLARFQSTRTIERFQGDAGGVAAIRRADELLENTAAVLVVAVDSFVSLEGLQYCLERRPSFWSVETPTPSEAAAAVLLTRRDGLLGTIEAAFIARGSAREDNDVPPDGKALSAALRRLPGSDPIRVVVGQSAVDDLRAREWNFAHTRNLARIPIGPSSHCFEKDAGRVGAAAGLANLAYGLAVSRHQTLPEPALREAPFLAWAISPDGTAGVALARGAPS
jgi:hypothetical protein